MEVHVLKIIVSLLNSGMIKRGESVTGIQLEAELDRLVAEQKNKIINPPMGGDDCSLVKESEFVMIKPKGKDDIWYGRYQGEYGDWETVRFGTYENYRRRSTEIDEWWPLPLPLPVPGTGNKPL